jgi:hypothetical protein
MACIRMPPCWSRVEGRQSVLTDRPSIERSWICLLVAAAIAIPSIVGTVPLTYDEAWNYTYVASRGIRFALFDYEYPNNHTLFTMLQAAIPRVWVVAWPPLLRAWNCVIAGLLFLLLFHAISGVRTRGLRAAWLTTCLLLCSPLFTLYLFVARGYLLGTTLLLAAAMWQSHRKVILAGLAAGLSAAVVPTFAYAFPGLVWALVKSQSGMRWRDRLGSVAIISGAFIVAAIPFYVLKLARVASHLQGWTVHSSGDFLRGLFENLATGTIFGVMLVALLLGTWVATTRRKSTSVSAPGQGDALVDILIAASVSFAVVVVAAALGKVARPPFVRNALFVPLFLWTAQLLRAERTNAFWRRSTLLVVSMNAGLGLYLLATSFALLHANPLSYPQFSALGAVPAQSLLQARRLRPVDALRARWAAIPVLQLYARALSLPLEETAEAAPSECSFGTHPPAADAAVWAVSDGERLPLCF